MKLRLGEKEYIGVDRSIKLAQRAAADNALKDQEAILQDFDEKQNSKNPPRTSRKSNERFVKTFVSLL